MIDIGKIYLNIQKFKKDSNKKHKNEKKEVASQQVNKRN